MGSEDWKYGYLLSPNFTLFSTDSILLRQDDQVMHFVSVPLVVIPCRYSLSLFLVVIPCRHPLSTFSCRNSFSVFLVVIPYRHFLGHSLDSISFSIFIVDIPCRYSFVDIPCRRISVMGYNTDTF